MSSSETIQIKSFCLELGSITELPEVSSEGNSQLEVIGFFFTVLVQWRGFGFDQKPDPGLCTSKEARFLKFYRKNILDKKEGFEMI